MVPPGINVATITNAIHIDAETHLSAPVNIREKC